MTSADSLTGLTAEARLSDEAVTGAHEAVDVTDEGVVETTSGDVYAQASRALNDGCMPGKLMAQTLGATHAGDVPALLSKEAVRSKAA